MNAIWTPNTGDAALDAEIEELRDDLHDLAAEDINIGQFIDLSAIEHWGDLELLRRIVDFAATIELEK